MAFAPDGKAVLVGAVDGTLRLWDLATGKELRSFARHGRAVRALAFSADGKMALSGGGDSILKLWDVAAGRQLRSFEAGSWWTKILAFAVDGTTVVSVSDTNGSHYIVRVWDLATGKAQNTIEFPSAMNATALAPDGKTLLSLSDDKLAQWDVHTGKELRNRKNSCGWFGSIAFSPDGKMGLVGCHDGSLRLWQLVP